MSLSTLGYVCTRVLFDIPTRGYQIEFCSPSLLSLPLPYHHISSLHSLPSTANDQRVVLSTDNDQCDYICASYVDVSQNLLTVSQNIHHLYCLCCRVTVSVMHSRSHGWHCWWFLEDGVGTQVSPRCFACAESCETACGIGTKHKAWRAHGQLAVLKWWRKIALLKYFKRKAMLPNPEGPLSS